MGLYSVKEYLTYFDLIDYLDDMGYFATNINNDSDVWRFNHLLLELTKSNQLTPVFNLSYPRPAKIIYYNKPVNEIDDFSDENEAQIIKEYSTEVDGYCCLPLFYFEELIKNYEPFYREEKPPKIIYDYAPYNKELENNCLIEFLEEHTPIVSHYDLLFSKTEIIKVFGDTPYNETIPKLNKAVEIIAEKNNKISQLQAEINRLNDLIGATALQPKKATDTAQNNALLILGVIMTELQKNKPYSRYTQADLINKIFDEHGHIKGLSPSNLEKTIADSKNHFKNTAKQSQK